MPEFIVRSGKYDGKKFILPGAEVLIGRDDGCQIRITSQDVSRQHCVIRLTESGWTLRDLGSQNGTYLNDVITGTEAPLRPGDRVRIGPMVLELSDPSVSPAPRPIAAGMAGMSSGTSDDEIASWLSDDEIPAAPGDTTIVTAVDTPPPLAADDTADSEVPPSVREPERKFKSIAEEAADIIRRHREIVAREEHDAAG